MKTTLATLQNFFPDGYRVFDVEHSSSLASNATCGLYNFDSIIAHARNSNGHILFVAYTEMHQKTGLLPRLRDSVKNYIPPMATTTPSRKSFFFKFLTRYVRSW